MGFKKIAFYAVVAVVALEIVDKIDTALKSPPVPHLNDTWWGPILSKNEKEDSSIRPFKINISDKVLKDLKYRLENHRPFVPPLEGIQQQYGTNTNMLKDIVEFWKTKYNWREREKYLNKYPQFMTNIQGLDIHYIHVKPTKTDGLKVLPLLLLHGWPGSIREFYEIIPILTSPQKDSKIIFEVIVPHLPGFGFSKPAVRPGLGASQMAVVFKNFMNRLGFEKYYVQGGDFGAIVLQSMAVLFPDSVLGFHSNMCTASTPKAYLKTFFGILFPSLIVRPDHYDRVYPLSVQFEQRLRETGYLHLQATKPDTLGVGLNDSPVGLTSYIIEKFITGTNFTWQALEDGGLKNVYAYEDVLDNIMIYWVSGSITTSFRLYAETFSKAHFALGITRIPITIPTACARFKNDFYAPDGLLSEIYQNLLHLSDYHGGHFAAFQLPEVLANDIFQATEKFENFNNNRNKQL